MLPFKNHAKFTFLDKLREFILIFIPFSLLFMIAVIGHYYNVYRTAKVTIETTEMLNVGMARSALNNALSIVLTDLKFLSNYMQVNSFDKQGNIKHDQVISVLKIFSEQKKLYDQIRFIDMNGQEQVRVNLRKGRSHVVAKEKLQNKSDRYYFREASSLGSGEIYVSPLDLNIEQEIIEQPLKPVIRFVVPIYTGESHKRGVLVLNFLAQRLLDIFSRATTNIIDQVHLLNNDGYWLYAPNGDNAWGFMLPHKQHFGQHFKQEWQEISQLTTAQFRTDKGLFTFETVTPLSVVLQSLSPNLYGTIKIPKVAKRWFIVANVTPQNDAPSPLIFFNKNLTFYLLILFILVFGSWLLAITRLKHRRAELEGEYERHFRYVLENMDLAVVNVDLNADINFCNNSFLTLTGWQREEILHKEWIDKFIVPEHQKTVRHAFNQLKKEGTLDKAFESELMTRDGSRLLLSWHNTLSYDTQGKISGITAIGEDITEKRRTESQVRKLSRVVEHSPSIVMLTDRKGEIEYVNPKFTQVTGYTLDEVIGKNPKILKSDELSEDDYQSLWKTILSGKVWRGEFHNKRKNGELYWESASISALSNNGEISNIIAVKEDITEQKRLEQEIISQNEKLAKHEALTVLGRMAGMIAHDLRNPLSSVKMSLQILARHASKEHKELQEIGLGQVLYMENILSDMLAYARPEKVKSEWIDISKLMQTIILSHQAKFTQSAIILDQQLASKIPYVSGDVDKLRRVFNNLIDNAIHALQHNDHNTEKIIKIITGIVDEAGKASLVVEVIDNGSGFGECEIEQLFEPFYTTAANGTGLGLAIVKQIIEQHHGSIKLYRRQDKETCAAVLLPILNPEAEENN